MPIFQVLPRTELAQAAAEYITTKVEASIKLHGRCTLALSGGSTPRPVYELLAQPPFSQRIDWSKLHIFWGDERAVAPDDERSNYHMTKLALLDHVPIPPDHIHRMHGELEPQEAAAAYELVLQRLFGGDPVVGPPKEGFDLILLGMGENAHTASLFPGMRAVHETTKWVMAEFIPEVDMWRITLTPVVINAANTVAFLVAGADKAEPLREVIEGPPELDRLPAQIVAPSHGQLVWLLDEAAAARLQQTRSTS